MKKVYFSHRLSDNGELLTGMPVSMDILFQKTKGKLISGIGVDGDSMDLLIRLGDQSSLRIWASHRGAEIVYTNAPE